MGLRLMLTLCSLLILVAVPAGASATAHVATSCAPYVVRGATDYIYGYAVTKVRRGRYVRDARYACGRERSDAPARVRRIVGVPVGVGMVEARTSAASRRVLAARGFFTVLDSHPMHRLLFRQPHRDALRDECGEIHEAIGEVAFTPVGNVFNLTLQDGSRLFVTIDSASNLKTPRTHFGLPFLDRGDRIRIRGPKCADFWRIVADTLEPV
jgi:hypothetical protein